MVPKLRFAATKDVPTKFGEEEFVLCMVQRGRFAAMKDVPTKLREEEFV